MPRHLRHKRLSFHDLRWGRVDSSMIPTEAGMLSLTLASERHDVITVRLRRIVAWGGKHHGSAAGWQELGEKEFPRRDIRQAYRLYNLIRKTGTWPADNA